MSDWLGTARPAILLVELERIHVSPLASYLAGHHLAVTTATSVGTAYRCLVSSRFSLVLVNLTGAAKSGLDLVRVLAARGFAFILIAEKSEEADRVLGLELGAADYVTAPFSPRELLARIRAVCRRVEPPADPLILSRSAEFSCWRLDLTTSRVVHQDGQVIRLSPGELGLLRGFVENPLRVMSRQELLSLTRRTDPTSLERTVDVLVAGLRGKLQRAADPPLIQTLRGHGYRFTEAIRWRDTPLTPQDP